MKRLVPDAIFDQHVILLGKTRSGKSSVARLCVEHLLDRGDAVCIVDPKGDWWGLKSSADGKSAGYPVVIFGGEHGDVPLNSRSGASVAELIATGNRSCVVDLGGWMPGDRTQLWIDFASTFFRLHRGRHFLVLDEVHNLCPKGKVFDVNAGKMLHWSNRLASEGLGKGISLIAASQRPQKVHNDFLTSCETLIAMRVIHKADRDALGDWIDGCGDPDKGKEVISAVAQMKRGEAWVWSPEAEFGPKRIQFPMFETYDSFKARSTAPAQLKGWADVNLDEVKKKLESVVKEAEANDPAKLKAKIAELQKQLRSAPAKTEMKEIRVADPRAIDRAVREAVGKTAKDVASMQAAMKRQSKTLADIAMLAAKAAAVEMPKIETPNIPPAFEALNEQRAAAPKLMPPFHAHRARTEPSNGDGELTPYQLDILRGLAKLEAMGRADVPFALAGVAAGKSAASSTFERYRSRLQSAGLVSYPKPGRLALTDEGRKIAPAPQQPITEAELQQRCLSLLTPYQQDLVRALIAAYPLPISREQLGESSGKQASSSTFERYVSSLRTMEIIQYPSSRLVKAADWLFL